MELLVSLKGINVFAVYLSVSDFKMQKCRMTRWMPNELQWWWATLRNRKYESKHTYESILYWTVFDELRADRQPLTSAFDWRQARQKRSNIRSISGYVVILQWFALIAAHRHCGSSGCSWIFFNIFPIVPLNLGLETWTITFCGQFPVVFFLPESVGISMCSRPIYFSKKKVA